MLVLDRTSTNGRKTIVANLI